MAEIPALLVKQLRDRTNAPFGDCKAALVEADADIEKAIEVLRKKNAAIQAKTSGRETAEGRVGLFIAADGSHGALIELRCESAPVAKNEHFVTLANDLCAHITKTGQPATAAELLAQPHHTDSGRTVNEKIGEVVGLLRENIKPHRMNRLEGKAVGGYVHHDGSVGVLVVAEGEGAPDASLLRDIAMHITAKIPAAVSRDQIPAELIEKEREIAKSQAESTSAGKPANIVEKIAENRVNTWLKESCLEEQTFIKDESKTVGQLLKAAGLKAKAFIRFKVGESA